MSVHQRGGKRGLRKLLQGQEVAELGEAFATKTDGIKSIPGCTWKDRTNACKLSFDLHMLYVHRSVRTHTHPHKV